MSCENIQSLFAPYLNGKLDDGQRQQVEQHLATCLDCQAELSFDGKLFASLTADHDIPALSPHFNQAVISQAASIKKPVWRKAATLAFERPWLVSILGIIFSCLFGLSYAAWNLLGSGIDFFLAFFPVVPLLIGLILLMTFGVVYVNEKFIERLVYSSGEK
ncbi:zf-HC2 domain-containing protein [candidate division KSB1 bacterium]|nr:zf-HC2 domain-containing protein [candidate division KSB1 bacterium]